MSINIISNIENGFGLQKDFNILKRELEYLGHTVYGVQYDGGDCKTLMRSADINLFLEVIDENFFSWAKKQYFIPNPEQWKPHYDSFIGKVDKVLCKTDDAMKIFVDLNPIKLGFTSNDILKKDIQKKYAFVHIGGKSNMKNTKAIVDCWKHYQIHVPIMVVSSSIGEHDIPGVHIAPSLPNGSVEMLLNSYLFNLCPSAYEGFGHVLHEGMSCGNVVITSNYAPMNECGINPLLLVPCSRKYPVGKAMAVDVDPCEIYKAVNNALIMTEKELEKELMYNRELWDGNYESFKINLAREFK